MPHIHTFHFIVKEGKPFVIKECTYIMFTQRRKRMNSFLFLKKKHFYIFCQCNLDGS